MLQLVGEPVAIRNASVPTSGETLICDLDAITASGGTERIVPAGRIEIQGINGTDILVAFKTGEIAATRYFTIPAGGPWTIEGPIVFRKIYAQASGAADDIEVLVFRG